MKKILLILTLVTSCLAQIPSKLDELKAKKEKAIQNINDIYKDELKKLLNDPIVKADPKILIAISDELGLSPPKEHLNTDPEWFVGISWVTTNGSKFVFSKTGRVTQQHNKNFYNYKWKFIKDRIIKVTGDFRDSSNSTERYFQFFDDGTAKYGASIENMISIKRE